MRLAIVPARGGSRGIPRKNLVLVGGKPLMQWSIDAALAASGIDAVAVSSDDPEILSLGERLGARGVKRPDELATDEASMLPVLQHCIAAVELQTGRPVDSIVLLQPTSPLRTTRDIEGALALQRATGARAVVSVVEVDNKPLKLFCERPDGSLRGVFSDEAPFARRQDLPRALQPNGAIYIYDACDIMAGSMFPVGMRPYIMPADRSVDVDTPEDLALVAARLGL
jgi:CMP-N-acetylneuraminic acid synthetase